MKRSLLAWGLLVLLAPVFASTVRYTVWQGVPINVVLPVNQDKVLLFSHPVQVLVPNSLSRDAITISNVAGKVTFHALKPFGVTRIAVVDTQHHKMLFDVESSARASEVTLAILHQAPQPVAQSASGYLKVPASLKGEMAYVTLTRYAEQQLYAPARLRHNPDGIQLVESYLKKGAGVTNALQQHPLFLDGSLVTIPWATWRARGLYVSAMLVRNAMAIPVDLTHELPLICGRNENLWKAVTFFPRWQLASRGHASDTTVAFLITSVPFNAAIKQCGGTL